MKSNNVIIAFEGLDNSFKETNHISFLNMLKYMRFGDYYKIHSESFPRYGHWSAKGLEKWLDGSIDRTMLKSHTKAINSLYSIDRLSYWYESDENGYRNIDFLNDKDKFHYFVFDRYNLSNTIYNPIHPGEVNIEDFTFDHDVYGIPNPNVIIWMRMRNFDVLADLISKKKNRDMNELEIDFLKDKWDRSEQIISSSIFDQLGIKLIVVDCLNDDDTIKSKTDISNYIWKSVGL